MSKATTAASGPKPKYKLFQLLEGLNRPLRGMIQIGANKGQEVPIFRAYGLSPVIMVEPLEEAYGHLVEAVGKDDDYIPVRALCSARDGEQHTFYVSDHDGQASSLLAPDRVLTAHPNISFATTVPMISKTVDTIVREVAEARPGLDLDQFDLLFLDTQGSELQVLMGATQALHRATAVWTEVSYDLYAGGATLEALQGFLSAFGFRLNNMNLNRHGWGNALFLKAPKA